MISEDLIQWILMHKSSVLGGMTRREQDEFTELFGKFRMEQKPDDNPVVLDNIAEAQSYIDGTLVSRIIMDAQRHFSGEYPTHVFALGVGPIQSMLGLAVKNGHIIPKQDPKVDEVFGPHSPYVTTLSMRAKMRPDNQGNWFHRTAYETLMGLVMTLRRTIQNVTNIADGRLEMIRELEQKNKDDIQKERDMIAKYIERVPQEVTYRQEHAYAIRYGQYTNHDFLKEERDHEA